MFLLDENGNRGLANQGIHKIDDLPAALRESDAVHKDPARNWPGAPPNFGRYPVPHIYTVAGFVGSMARAYPIEDIATKHSQQNAERMRADASVMECLEARQRAVALLPWHLVPEDENDPRQKTLIAELTKILERTRRFTELRRNLMEAIWYGRSMTWQRFGVKRIGNYWRKYIQDWEPRHADKIMFRYDDGSTDYLPGQVGVRVHASWATSNPAQVEGTQYGLVYWLRDHERKTVAVHKHMIEDGPFYQPREIGRIHGVGIRDRIYWSWYAAKEAEANLLEYLERTALGIEIWRYPSGNVEAEAATREAAKKRVSGGRSIVLVPVIAGEDSDLYGVEHIEPSPSGAELLKTIVGEFYGHRIKRYILGQTLSSEADATGLGSGVADAHLATFADIVAYDAVNLEETVTEEIVQHVKDINFPQFRGTYVRFCLDTESPEIQEKLEALERGWGMGLKLKSEQIYKLLGTERPDEQDDVLQNPAMVPPEPMPEEMPEEAGPSVFGPMSDQGEALDQIFAAGGDGAQAYTQPGEPERYARLKAQRGQMSLWDEEAHPRHSKGATDSKGGQFAEKHEGTKLAETHDRPATDAEKSKYADYVDFLRTHAGGKVKPHAMKDWLHNYRATQAMHKQKEREKAQTAPPATPPGPATSDPATSDPATSDPATSTAAESKPANLKERLREAIRETQPADLLDLAEAVGVKAGTGHDPLASPLNRALAEMTEAGEITATTPRFGQPTFSLPDDDKERTTADDGTGSDTTGSDGTGSDTTGSDTTGSDGTEAAIHAGDPAPAPTPEPEGPPKATSTSSAAEPEGRKGNMTAEEIRDTVVRDFGRHIPGARKHGATPTGTKAGGSKPKDDRPGWARRYEVSQITKSTKPGEEGRWSLVDKKQKRWGQPKEIGIYDTEEEANAMVPIAEAERTHATHYHKADDPTPEQIARTQAEHDELTAKIKKEIYDNQEKWERTGDVKKQLADGDLASEGYYSQVRDGQIMNDFDYERHEQMRAHLAEREAKKIGPNDVKEYVIYRKVARGKYPVVKGGFETRDEAKQYLLEHAQEIVEHKFPNYEQYQYLDEVQRTGGKERKTDVHVPKTAGDRNDFSDTFGFSGGQFGKWQTNKSGQIALNHAYDAFNDLAEMLGIDPKGVSLNGRLAMAFGARGTGGKKAARAHYEPVQEVINLTKMSGAGTVAHEWAHALDHYIHAKSHPDGHDAPIGWASDRLPRQHQLRDDLATAVKGIVEAMHGKRITKAIDKGAATSYREKASANIKELLDKLEKTRTEKHTVHKQYYKRARPFKPEEQKEWDQLKADILKGDPGEGTWEYAKQKGRRLSMSGRPTFPKLERMNTLYKQATGHSFYTSQDHSEGRQIYWAIENARAADERHQEATAGKKETVNVPTDYLHQATKLDKTRASNYYTEPTEMFARAFEAYVYDKLNAAGRKSQYLVGKAENKYYRAFGMAPFPEGEEREAINAAFDKLFQTVKQRKNADTVEIYTARQTW